MKNLYKQIFTNEVFANETVTSTIEDIRHCLGFMVDLSYTGSSLAGTAKLQFKTELGSSWRDAPNSGDTAHHTLGASGGNVQWYVKDAYAAYVRLAIVSSDADEVTANADIFAKGV
jgi:hypothetical protein